MIKLHFNAKNIKGYKFGKLTAVESTNQRSGGSVVWKCKCDCGNEQFIRATSLINGHTSSCGCERSSDTTNQRFGKLLVIEPTDRRYDQSIVWKCQCDCGNVKYVSVTRLINKNAQSCGCYQSEARKVEFGESAFNHLLCHYKVHARKRNLDFKLTKEQFRELTSKSCYYCGQEPNHISINHHGNGDYVYNGIDRIDNSKGYFIENCVPCCETCNRAKLSMNMNEFLNWISQVYFYSSIIEYT